jgi:diketogulonate reductase-like aldo/keto reductase
LSGQDPANLPYDPRTSLAEQVSQSFLSSQKNLRTDFIDSYVLHSPLSTLDKTLEVWTQMEKIHLQGGAQMLGMSNCYDLAQFSSFYEQVTVKPKILQNRFYRDTFYDCELRKWCKEKGIIYQSFWTLTANPDLLNSPEVSAIAQARSKTGVQVLFRFLAQIGIVPLTGTTSEEHMREDLQSFDFELTPKELATIEAKLDSECGLSSV